MICNASICKVQIVKFVASLPSLFPLTHCIRHLISLTMIMCCMKPYQLINNSTR